MHAVMICTVCMSIVSCLRAYYIACLSQIGLGLTHSKFLTHLTGLSDPHQYIEKSVDLDHSAFNLPKDLEEKSLRIFLYGQVQMCLSDTFS